MSAPQKPATGWPKVIIHTPRGFIRHSVRASDPLTAAAIVNTLKTKP